MGLRINNNASSLSAVNSINRANQLVNRTNEGLASGLRINRAADDAAGLAIAERLRARVRQMNVEVQNLQSGVNVVQTADSGLAAQTDNIQRMRELAVQASSGTLTDDQRAMLNQEAQQVMEQIDQTARDTQYNETALLDQNRQVELGTEGSVQVTLNESTTDSLGLTGLDLSTAEGAAQAVDRLDTAANQVSQSRASLGAQENRLVSAISQRETTGVNEQAAESQIRDLEYARAAADRVRNQILAQGGIAALMQGNVQSQTALRLLGG